MSKEYLEKKSSGIGKKDILAFIFASIFMGGFSTIFIALGLLVSFCIFMITVWIRVPGIFYMSIKNFGILGIFMIIPAVFIMISLLFMLYKTYKHKKPQYIFCIVSFSILSIPYIILRYSYLKNIGIRGFTLFRKILWYSSNTFIFYVILPILITFLFSKLINKLFPIVEERFISK